MLGILDPLEAILSWDPMDLRLDPREIRRWIPWILDRGILGHALVGSWVFHNNNATSSLGSSTLFLLP